MNIFLSILRGINVSGKNKILMSDLKKLYENLGFEEVNTYIQSGNVVFKSLDTINNQKLISQKIEFSIFSNLGLKVSVLVLNLQELQNLVHINPFLSKDYIGIEKLYVTFLENVPLNTNIEKIYNIQSNLDEFELIEKFVFLHCPTGYGNTKFSNQFFENKLNLVATTRNWKTTTHLLKLMESYAS